MLIFSNSQANRLFKLAVSLSSSFLQKFITWITKSYEESIRAGFKDDKAWCITTKLGECVFRTIYEVRSGVSNSFTNEPKQMASVIWLTVGKTHDAMEEFMLKDFKNRSSINGEFIKLWFKTTTLMKCPLTELNWPALNKKWPVLNSSKASRLEISTENLNPRARLQSMPPTRQRQWKKL